MKKLKPNFPSGVPPLKNWWWDHPLNFNQIKKAEYYETSSKHSAFPSGKSRGPATEK